MSRVVMITGTSRGLGLGLAEHFLAKGDTVLGCSRGPAALAHERYAHAELDVADEAAVTRFVRAAARDHGQVDVLVNNAGIARMNPVLLTTGASASAQLGTNFLGTFLFSREVGKVMARRRRGAIVNLSTVARPLRLEGEAVYAASKAAVESLTQVLARELGPLGITVNAVGPTPIPTDLLRGVSQAGIDALLARQAIRRLGTIEDLAHVVDFLVDPRSAFVTGQVIYLGGVAG